MTSVCQGNHEVTRSADLGKPMSSQMFYSHERSIFQFFSYKVYTTLPSIKVFIRLYPALKYRVTGVKSYPEIFIEAILCSFDYKTVAKNGNVWPVNLVQLL